MKNVIDSSAWLSYFAEDGNCENFTLPIENIDNLIVPSITITEIFKHILRERNEESALTITAHMSQGKVISLDQDLAIEAASFGVNHKLPLTDSIIYATTLKFDATLWTQDADFKGLSNVNYFSKSSST